jgi:hypothetical protein
MKENFGMRAFSVLLAMMLVGAVMVPAVSAEAQTSTGIDFDQYAIPDLKIDSSMETIAISGALSPQVELGETERGIYGIPSGSVIVHAVDGTTQVFDKNGNPLLSISDERSGKVPTPAGVEKPGTKVHQLPNDSRVYHHGDKIFVLDPAGALILVVLDESTSSDPILTDWNGNDWVESAEDYLNSITEYVAYWTVPSNPPSLGSNERIYLFNGIQGIAGSKRYLLQPVLGYNGLTSQWEGQAWACHTNGNDDFTGPLFTSGTGHSMKGRIYWSSSLQLWSITLYDLETGQYSSVSTSCMVPQNNCLVACVLEGWNIDDNDDVPGDTLFYDMVYKSYGIPMSVDLEPWYSTNVPYEIMRYCWVDVIQDPTQVRLNTYN